MEIRARREFERKAQRVESLVQELEALEDEGAKRSAVEAVQALLDLHGDVFQRVLEIAGPEVVARLVEDEAVSGLLLLHGLHPLALEDRVRRSLDRVRPYLDSHGGGVEVLAIREGLVRLRLEGSCHGCPSSTATIKYAIEEAIMQGAPDVARIEVEGVVEPAPAPGFVPLGSIKGPQPKAAWHVVHDLPAPGGGGVVARDVAGARLVFCMAGSDWYAYVDRCPGCGASLEGAAVEGGALACPGCDVRFDVRRAGRGIGDAALHLEPVPLLPEGDAVKVAVPERPAAVV